MEVLELRGEVFNDTLLDLIRVLHYRKGAGYEGIGKSDV